MNVLDKSVCSWEFVEAVSHHKCSQFLSEDACLLTQEVQIFIHHVLGVLALLLLRLLGNKVLYKDLPVVHSDHGC